MRWPTDLSNHKRFDLLHHHMHAADHQWSLADLVAVYLFGVCSTTWLPGSDHNDNYNDVNLDHSDLDYMSQAKFYF
jgi:hypothetical protein